MIQSKPKETFAGEICPACREGTLALGQIEYVEKVAQDNPINFPAIWVDRCDSCSEIIFPGETTAFIESVVADQKEQLTPEELETIRLNLDVKLQDEMSEILGLGSKTYHRWEKGAQFPTRSMSFYIRVLAQYPDAFEWLRKRGWRNASRLNNFTSSNWRFPDLEKLKIEAAALPLKTTIKRNAARGFDFVKFTSK